MSTILGVEPVSGDCGNVSIVCDINTRNTSGNFTTGEQPLDTTPFDVLGYILYVVGVSITIASVAGNIFVIIAILKEKRLRKVGNIFVTNLAASNGLLGAIVCPLAIVHAVLKQWSFDEVVCHILTTFHVLICTSSMLTLCAIVYDRYKAIVQPVKYSRKRTLTRICTIVIAIWGYSCLVTFSRYLIRWEDNLSSTNTTDCFLPSDIGYVLLIICASFVGPFVFLLYFYCKLYCVLTRAKNTNLLALDSERLASMKSSDSITQKMMSCLHSRYDKDQQLIDQSTQTPCVDPAPDHEHDDRHPTDETSRRESLEPELLAIYQMRHRSNRILSNVTIGSVGSAFYSSTDSSNTATTSFSESSDRSSSVFSEGRDRSYSSSTERSHSLSVSELGLRRSSFLRGHRLSSARQSSLHTEVIHEIASAARLDQLDVDDTFEPANKQPTDHVDTDDTHDEMSDGERIIPKTKRKLKSSTFRRRNSRKSRRMTIARDKRAAKTFSVVTVCFVLFWVPFIVLMLVHTICHHCSIPTFVIYIVCWLTYTNSACIPIIYKLCSKDFDTAFKKLLCHRRNRDVVYL